MQRQLGNSEPTNNFEALKMSASTDATHNDRLTDVVILLRLISEVGRSNLRVRYLPISATYPIARGCHFHCQHCRVDNKSDCHLELIT